MATEEGEQLAARITELGETIKQAKTDQKPKEEWEPALQEMISLKVSLARVQCKALKSMIGA
jgi:hypothetical protein